TVTREAIALSALLLLGPGSNALAAPHAHEHGVARLAVAVDGNALTIALDAPLDGFLGFERAPRTDAERKAAADLLARLRDAGALFKPDAAAGCKAADVKVEAPVLEPGYKGKGEHADLEAQFHFQCAQPQALRVLDVALFDAFKLLQRIDVQVAGVKGQSKVTLKRPARAVNLPR
ncbi:MAG: hypothetical protein RJA10_4379, partial [Pseudomonadota bacterium]